MVGDVWTIRGVSEEVRKLAASAAKARRMTVREWIEEAVQAHAKVTEHDALLEPAKFDLVELIQRIERVERHIAGTATGTPQDAPKAAPAVRQGRSSQNAPSAKPRPARTLPKLAPGEEAAARIMADAQASGVELFKPAKSGEAAGRRLTEAGEDLVRQISAQRLSHSAVARLVGINKATVKRVVEAKEVEAKK